MNVHRRGHKGPFWFSRSSLPLLTVLKHHLLLSRHLSPLARRTAKSLIMSSSLDAIVQKYLEEYNWQPVHRNSRTGEYARPDEYQRRNAEWKGKSFNETTGLQEEQMYRRPNKAYSKTGFEYRGRRWIEEQALKLRTVPGQIQGSST